MQIFLVLGTLLLLILPADNALRIGIARIIDPFYVLFGRSLSQSQVLILHP